MIGQEHYGEAEQFLRKAAAADDVPTTQALAAIAQVHATLAVAAAIYASRHVSHVIWMEVDPGP